MAILRSCSRGARLSFSEACSLLVMPPGSVTRRWESTEQRYDVRGARAASSGTGVS